MSKKFRIGGVALALMLLASLIVGAIPTSASALGWSVVSTPGALGEVLQAGSDVNLIATAPDGNTMFAYDNVVRVGADTNNSRHLYKSTNAGKTWTTVGIGDGPAGTPAGGPEAAGVNAVAITVSPNYATDSTVVIVTGALVLRSINSGKTFGDVGSAALMALVAGGSAITSVDVADHYLGGQAILVGIQDPAAGTTGGVFRYTTSGLAWTDLKVGNVNAGTAPAGGGREVLAVKFSPNHQGDAGYLAVITDPVVSFDTWLTYKFSGDNWNLGVLDARLWDGSAAATDCPTTAVIAFPSDYEWSSNNYVMVGTAGATTIAGAGTTGKDDVYRVQGALPGGASKAYDLDCNGNTSETDVWSLAVKGAIAEANVLVGQAGSNSVRRSSDVTASTPTWKGATKAPTGAGNVSVLFSPTTDNSYAATAGAAGDGSGFSISTDSGATFNTVSLMDVSNLANPGAAECALTIADIAVIDNTTIYMILADADDSESLFKTTDAGASWQRIWYQYKTQGSDMFLIALSPAYATDSTLFVAQNDTRVWKTTNAGQTFIGLTAPAAITTIGVVDKSTYYTGHANAFYKSGRWTSATLKGDTAVTIVVTPASEILVGTNNGNVLVSTDDGKNFDYVGAQSTLGVGANVFVAIGPDYATSKYIYAGSSAAANGLQRFQMGAAAPWKAMDLNAVTAGTQVDALSGVVVSPDNSLYAGSPTPMSGVYRSVGPASPLDKLGFQQLLTDYPIGGTPAAGDTGIMGGLNIVAGSNVLYAIADIDLDNAAADDQTGTYGYEYRIITFEDTLTSEVALSAPKNNTITPPNGQVTFSWTKVAANVDLTYQLEVATDVDFANKVVAVGLANTGTTTGTSITYGGFTGGTDYWFRVKITQAGATPISSKWSAKWKFSPQIAQPVLQSPAAGEMYAALMPTFSWNAVGGAESYTLEMADNPFYANSQVKKPLTHNVWTWDEELEIGKTYYWRVQALKGANVSNWTEQVFTVNTDPNITAAEMINKAQQPAVVIPAAPPAPTPVINLPAPIVNLPATPAPTQVSPPFIWAIIIIGAILVIAVIVLIVRTRRVS